MEIIYSYHSKKRLKQRGITELDVQHVLKYPIYTKKSFEERKEAVGEINNKRIKVIFIEKENYIKIITIM
ncbi:MAG: DUF4258 domain-containing protein [Nanoarchaeota archaeon]|nr:DUF4258 domain-containing protein [Nanoarchaeota archaeon]